MCSPLAPREEPGDFPAAVPFSHRDIAASPPRGGGAAAAPMNPTVPPIESILAAGVEIDSPPERRQFIDHACAGDAELKRRFDELVENHFRAGSFLESPASP